MLSVLFLGLAGALQISNAPAISADALPSRSEKTVEVEFAQRPNAPSYELSSECAALFGNEKAHIKNRKRREKRFLGVFTRRNGREVVHSVKGWQKISPLRMPYVQYHGTLLRDGKRRAHLTIKHPVCGNVRRDFLLSVDDSIGKHARVMAVLRDGILIEHGKALTHLHSKDSKDDLRLIWRSPFYLSVSGNETKSIEGSIKSTKAASALNKAPSALRNATLTDSKLRDTLKAPQLMTRGKKKKAEAKKSSGSKPR